MDDVRGYFVGPTHSTTPAEVTTNKNTKVCKVMSLILIIINSLFVEDDIFSQYNYLSNILTSATKQKQII